MTYNPTELLSCPHCGKVDTLELSTRRELEDCPNFDDCEAETCGRGFCDMYDNWDCVVCSVYKGGCGATGGYDECPAKAIEKWNTRTTEQAIAATLENGTCAQCAKNMGAYADSLCDPLKERVNELLRCLENDWHIRASWDGLRKFWCIELTEEGVRVRDATHGTLTAEQVMTIAGKHQPDYCSDTHVCFDWQAIADELNAELGGYEYEEKMDSLLCYLTNGKFSKSRKYSLDFMKSCVDEEYETLYAEELANAKLESGTLTADDVLNAVYKHGARWQAIADELNATFGGGECELVYGENDHGDDGWWCQSCGGWFAASFRHTGRNNIIKPSHCQHCGKAVKR